MELVEGPLNLDVFKSSVGLGWLAYSREVHLFIGLEVWPVSLRDSPWRLSEPTLGGNCGARAAHELLSNGMRRASMANLARNSAILPSKMGS